MFEVLLYSAVAVVPIATAFLIRKVTKRVLGLLLSIAVSTVILTSAELAVWMNQASQVEDLINSLDSDADGSISSEDEDSWTTEERSRYHRAMNDGGRNTFAFVVLPPFLLVYSTVVVGVYWLVARVAPCPEER